MFMCLMNTFLSMPDEADLLLYSTHHIELLLLKLGNPLPLKVPF